MAVFRFFRSLLRGVARFFAFLRASILNLLLLALILAVALPLVDAMRTDVADGVALLLAPAGAIVERRTPADPLTLLGGGSLAQTRLDDTLRAIEQAADDDRISVLVLDPSSLGNAPPAALEDIGGALAAFRDAGKRIVATSRSYDRDQYYLASFADEVHLHPLGEVTLRGYAMSSSYYRGLLDRLDVNVHVFRVGDKKEAVEPLTRTDMSPAARAVNQQTVDALWARWVGRVAANRGLPPEAVRGYADRYDEHLAAAGGDSAEAALAGGLVDAISTDAEIGALLRDLTGAQDEAPYRRIAADAYLAPRRPTPPGDVVAVITAAGPIISGGPPAGFVGADSMAKLLRQARSDTAVKALVLRVDSPGGGVMASSRIHQQLAQVRQAGKPVVVSMGATAASGGYWISAGADRIWAAPTTITGSIGVFAVLPTFEDSLGAVGVTRDGVATGPFADVLDPTAGLAAPMARALQTGVDHAYQRFLETVGAGRNMSAEAVDAVAQGRIWTGAQALDVGLVDALGSLENAIADAAELAGLGRFGVRHMADELSMEARLLLTLMDQLDAHRPTTLQARLRARFVNDLRALGAFSDPKRLYALCEGCQGLR